LVVTLDAQAEECWVPSPFACFPFTSPTVRFHVPPDPESAIPPYKLSNSQLSLTDIKYVQTVCYQDLFLKDILTLEEHQNGFTTLCRSKNIFNFSHVLPSDCHMVEYTRVL